MISFTWGYTQGMKLIIYAHTELLTGDAIAVAVLQYSAALAENGLAELIEIPIIEPDGFRNTALLLLGPASQIVAKGARTDREELFDTDLVAALRHRTRVLRPEGMADADDPADVVWHAEV